MIGAILGGIQLAQTGLGLLSALRGSGQDTRAMQQAAQRVSEASRQQADYVSQAAGRQDDYRRKLLGLMGPVEQMRARYAQTLKDIDEGKDIGRVLKGDVGLANAASRQLQNIRTMGPKGITSFEKGGARKLQMQQMALDAETNRKLGEELFNQYRQAGETAYQRFGETTDVLDRAAQLTELGLPKDLAAMQSGVVSSYGSALNATRASTQTAQQGRENEADSILGFGNTLGTLVGKFDNWNKARKASGSSSTSSPKTSNTPLMTTTWNPSQQSYGSWVSNMGGTSYRR